MRSIGRLRWSLSDINLDFGFPSTVLFSFFLAWPGVLGGAAIGALIGALAWRKRRLAGGVLGGLLGVLIGWGVGFLGYLAWADTDISVSVDFFDAVILAVERSAPGLLFGAAIGGAVWPSRRDLGLVIGAVAAGALSATLWFALAGGR
jgi:hypothetical protein